MVKLRVRDACWVITLVAVLCGWLVDHERLRRYRDMYESATVWRATDTGVIEEAKGDGRVTIVLLEE